MSRLPPELWAQIFLYAAWIPGAFETANHHAIAAFARDTHGISVHNRFNDTLSTKFSISLVCKDWNHLVAQTLFQYIIIKSGNHALRIASIIQKPRMAAPRSSKPGQWTLRVELALEGAHVWTEAYMMALASILRGCPNLTVFSTAFCTSDLDVCEYPGICMALAGLGPKSKLRRLELRSNPCTLNHVLSLVTAPLEVLWMLPPRRILSVSQVTLNFPLLKSLVSSFNDTSQHTRNWRMPLLQNLLTFDFSDLQSRMRTSSNHLVHLSLPTLFMIPESPLCPNLQDIVLKHDSLSFRFQAEEPNHMQIRRITIENPNLRACCAWNFDDNEHHLHRRSSVLALVPENFPALESIRFLLPLPGHQEDNSIPTLSAPWIAWAKLCLGKGIQILYSQGADDWTADIWKPLAEQDIYEMESQIL